MLKLRDAERSLVHVERSIVITSVARAMRLQDLVTAATAAGKTVVLAPARFQWVHDGLVKSAKAVCWCAFAIV